MKFIFNPSLEHIALVKIVATLWNQDDVRSLMRQSFAPLTSTNRNENWQKIEDNVAEKVAQLPVPGILKEKILGLVKPIGSQLYKWIEFHYPGFYFSVYLPNEPCWTSQGTLDIKKTAEVIIKNKNSGIISLFMLACIYCLEDEIQAIWEEMPGHLRKCIKFEENEFSLCVRNSIPFEENEFSFRVRPSIPFEESELGCYVRDSNSFEECKFHFRVREISLLRLVHFWIQELNLDSSFTSVFAYRGFQESSDSAYRFCFLYTQNIHMGNTIASEYFLKKLIPTESKKTFHMSLIDGVYKTDCHVLCFLLSKLEDEQREQILKYKPYDVLSCFLNWPFQSFFMETANNMWSYLSGSTYKFLLKDIINKTAHGFKDFNYQELFGKFWKESPSSLKRYVVLEFDIGIILSDLCLIEDKHNLALILQDISAIENKELVYCDRVLNFCHSLAICKKWNLLKFFVQECFQAESEMSIFKKRFTEHLTPHQQINWGEQLDQVFRLPDGSAYKRVKRNAEESETSS